MGAVTRGRRSAIVAPEADDYVRRALAALWPQVGRRIPDLAGSRAEWDGWAVSVHPKRKIPPEREAALEEAAEQALEDLGLGEVRVYLESGRQG